MKLPCFLASLLISIVGLIPQQCAAHSKPPNILFLFADDWGRFASIYSEVNGKGGINDVVRTPNFDKLARSGVCSATRT